MQVTRVSSTTVQATYVNSYVWCTVHAQATNVCVHAAKSNACIRACSSNKNDRETLTCNINIATALATINKCYVHPPAILFTC